MRKFLIWGSLVIVIVAGLFIYWRFFFTYSEGYRAGLLQKFSKRGNIFKTYEGEMILSSIESNKNVALASEKFLFSVTEDEIVKQLIDLEGKFIVVRYHETHGRLPWRGDTKYYVDSIRVEP
jgi:hypothetical protein